MAGPSPAVTALIYVSGPEMFRQLQALRLVIRSNALAVKRVRSHVNVLVDEPPHDLPVLEDERHFARAHLQHCARTMAAGARMAEAGVEEAGIMHAKLTHQRIERHHLGGVIGRHLHRLFGGEDIELAGIENETARPARAHRFPEIANVVAGAALDVDDAGVALGTVADDAIWTKPGEG